MHLKTFIRKDLWPLYIAMVVLLLPVLAIGYNMLQHTDGDFSLPRDESFLQLATAKTLAFRQVWGIGRYDFAAASPSLLYPLLMAVVFFIFGAHLMLTAIVNLTIALLLLTAIQRWLVSRGIRPPVQLFILLAVVLLTPLPLMVIFGMERLLLLLFAFLFVSRLSDEWAGAIFSPRTFLYGALLVASRYDGVLLVAGVCLLLLVRRKWFPAYELALWCLLPILVFGFIALSKGSYFLPNTFMLMPVSSWISYDWLIGCGVAVAMPLLAHRRWTVAPHRGSHRPGGEDPGGGVPGGGDRGIHPPDRKMRWIVGLTALVIVTILMTRNLYAYRETDRSSIRVHREEYPVGQFASRYYSRYPIASDDMGVVSFLTEGRHLDLSGLGSIKIARSKTDNSSSPELIHRLTREQNTQLVIISDRYNQRLPENWIRTARWELPANDLSGEKTFSFYAMDSASATRLKSNMVEYASFLPPDVTVQYFYFPPVFSPVATP